MPLSIRILLSLLAGIAAGAALAAVQYGNLETVVAAANVVGTV